MQAARLHLRRVLGLVAVAVGLAALVIAAIGYHQHRQCEAQLGTLADYLWVVERDLSRYYAPGTPESREVAEALGSRDHLLAERGFDRPILYRRGFTSTGRGEEPILVVGFNPLSIRAPVQR